MILLACLALLVALGLLERLAVGRARVAVPIRIHVNGTRGKSTVTRLIAAALREAGVPTMAKVTGTAPRLILPDGSEHPIVRRAPASIREQAWLVRRAARAGARALVVECMAVRPDLQWVSERQMLQATIGVITNVRLDHTEAMGATLDQVAQSLANSVPRGGVLVTDQRFAAAGAARCAALGTRLVIAEAVERPPDPAWLWEDMATALAVTRELGIADEIAMRGMQKAAADPGAATGGVTMIAGRRIAWVDATAANDPESLDRIVMSPAGLKPCPTAVSDPARGGILAVYNHRADRPERLRTFARHSATFRNCAAVLVTGDPPGLSLMMRARRLCPGPDIRFVPRRRLTAAASGIVSGGAEDPLIIFCGNTRGFLRPFPANAPDTGHRTPDAGRRPEHP
jgi:poly-gamma-glutamate synthase PgsB/CapB